MLTLNIPLLRHILIICMLHTCTFSIEPQCSPFHYHEQMIEKMVKLEILVQKMKDDMDVTQRLLVDEMTVLRSQWEEQRTLMRNDSVRIKREQDELRKVQEEVMEEIKDTVKTPTIAFNAKDLRNTSPSSNEILVYKTTLLNEGQGYDNTTGKFTAPVDGTYVFTAQFCLSDGSGHHIYYDFVSEGIFIKRGFFRDYDTVCCYTADVVTVLKAGAQVWITSPSIGASAFYETSMAWNTFSGVLMHQ